MNDNRQSLSRDAEFVALALSGVVFGAIALIGLLVYGEADARSAAILAAILACASQFVGSNTFGSRKLFLVSILFGWAAFLSMGISLLLLAF